jgi:AcrR family transcriptional regulator
MVTNLKMKDGLTRRERKKQETRRRLMEAALRLFSRYGYDATTVQRITDAADVAKSTFFNYFETKEAIVPALVQWQLQRLEETLLLEQSAPASPVARIKLALRLIIQNPLSDPVLMRHLFAAGARQQDIQPAHVLTNLLADQVRQAQTVGEIRMDLEPIYVGSLIRALFFQQMFEWHHGDRSESLPELLDMTVDLLMDGIAGPKWRRA